MPQRFFSLFRVFDDETVHTMIQVYEELRGRFPDLAKETIATAVITAAEDGARAFDQMCQLASADLSGTTE